MAENEMNKLTIAELIESDFLQCKQCHKHFNSPILLPCLHIFCADCIVLLHNSIVTNGNSNKMVQFQCPLCQAAVTMPKEMTPIPFLQSLCQLRAFKHGADRICSYCKFDGKNKAAESLCLTCTDDMCDSCAEAHRKTRITRNHIIAPYAQIKKGLFDQDIRACQMPQCSQHNSEFDQFCCDCIQLTCKTCQTDNHTGHNLMMMEAAIAKMQPEVTSFIQGLKRRIPALSEYQAYLDCKLKQLAKKKKELTERVEEQVNTIHTLANLYSDSLKEDINTAFIKEFANIRAHKKDLEVTKLSLAMNAELLDNLLSLGSSAEILQAHPAVMRRLKQLIHMKTNTITQHLTSSFNPGPVTQQNIRIMFGSLDVQWLPANQDELVPKTRLSISTVLPELLDPPQFLYAMEAKLAAEHKGVWPSGLFIRKEKMLLVDRDNKTVKIYDCTSVPPKLHLQFSGNGEHKLINPFDAVLLENGVAVVTDHGAEKVKIFDVTGQWIGDLAGEFRHPRGICVTNKSHLVVVDGLLLCLTVHDPDTGKLLQTIPAKGSGNNKLLVDPFYVAVTESDNFVVTDHAAPNIKVFDPAGGHLATYGTYGINASEVLRPYGICIDRYGQMLVADSDNHRVHLLLPDGTFSCFLLTNQHKVTHPVTLAINQDGNLVVGEA